MSTDDTEPFPGMELTDEMRSAVTIEEHHAPGPAGAPDVRVLVYRPTTAEGTLPLVISLHGGAFARRPDNFPVVDARTAMLGAVVVAVDYRTIPDDPYPSAIEDCYAVLNWAVAALDVDADRVVVSGVSAGGALAAALTQLVRDRGGPTISHQMLIIPVLDDRCRTPSMRQYVEAPFFGGRQANEMWSAYLGNDADRATTSPYAAPARAASLAGLPPAYIQVGGLDPLRDEGIEYAMRLMADDVPVELYCVPGMHHGLPEDPRTASHAANLATDAMRAALART